MFSRPFQHPSSANWTAGRTATGFTRRWTRRWWTAPRAGRLRSSTSSGGRRPSGGCASRASARWALLPPINSSNMLSHTRHGGRPNKQANKSGRVGRCPRPDNLLNRYKARGEKVIRRLLGAFAFTAGALSLSMRGNFSLCSFDSRRLETLPLRFNNAPN